MSVVKQAADSAGCRIVLIELVITYGVAFETDSEHLALNCGNYEFLVVALDDLVKRFLESHAGCKSVAGNVLESVGDPDIEQALGTELTSEIFSNLNASTAVSYPEGSYLFIGGGQSKSVLYHGVTEEGGVEVDTVKVIVLCKLDPFGKIFFGI